LKYTKMIVWHLFFVWSFCAIRIRHANRIVSVVVYCLVHSFNKFKIKKILLAEIFVKLKFIFLYYDFYLFMYCWKNKHCISATNQRTKFVRWFVSSTNEIQFFNQPFKCVYMIYHVISQQWDRCPKAAWDKNNMPWHNIVSMQKACEQFVLLSHMICCIGIVKI